MLQQPMLSILSKWNSNLLYMFNMQQHQNITLSTVAGGIQPTYDWGSFLKNKTLSYQVKIKQSGQISSK